MTTEHPTLDTDLVTDTGPDAAKLATTKRICIATPDILGPIKNGGIGTAYHHLARLLADERARGGHRLRQRQRKRRGRDGGDPSPVR